MNTRRLFAHAREVPVERYRLVRSLPRHLDYLTASYVLEIAMQRDESLGLDQRVFRARREGTGAILVIATIATTLADRGRILYHLEDGFDVEPGTPTSKIMERLVRDGVAREARRRRGH